MVDEERLALLREQFDKAPYPNTPLEKSPRDLPNELFLHSLTTAYYLRYQQVPDLTQTVILDAGCGSGYKSLMLALANPGAKIIGVDLSSESIALAQKRLPFHGVHNADFFVHSIYELKDLGLTFDYINCDEVLYLLPDPDQGLRAMREVLKPQGILRVNLHSALQRAPFYRAQSFCRLLGLMESSPGEMEVALLKEIMTPMKDQTDLKRRAWTEQAKTYKTNEWILVNYLLQGDKGYTVPDLFRMLERCDLEFMRMLVWPRWEITSLFNELPEYLATGLPETSIEDQLHLFELLQPIHRLLDFWCALPGTAPVLPLGQWTIEDWAGATIRLHPQLATEQLRRDLVYAVARQEPFQINRYLMIPSDAPTQVNSQFCCGLLPLWAGPQPLGVLVDHALKVRPVRPQSLQPYSFEDVAQEIRQILGYLEQFCYVMITL